MILALAVVNCQSMGLPRLLRSSSHTLIGEVIKLPHVLHAGGKRRVVSPAGFAQVRVKDVFLSARCTLMGNFWA